LSLIFLNRKELEDDVLLRRYSEQGDMESLGILYDRYLHLVYGLCLKYLKSRDASQDAVMDIYEILATKLKTQEVSYFKSWLYMVSKNHCLMILRKPRTTKVLVDENMESEYVLHPNEEDSLEDDLLALEDCIEQLKEDQKQCVRMFYLDRKSYDEIAGLSDHKLEKVKSYIQNGKRNLKICLEGKHVKR
jgi:RNA polymerase sigma factor (sigma-70 family)